MNGIVMVVTHKEYEMPKSECYKPMIVGNADISSKFLQPLSDSTGDNIAEKNSNYCELTGLYWLWKNQRDLDYGGLVHYRRHFMSLSKSKNKFENILTENEIEQYLEKFDAIIPEKRNYYIETTQSQFEHAHYKKDLDLMKEVLLELYPSYEQSYDWAMKQKKSHRFNMMIMKKNILDSYCEWLFSILFELENRVDITEYDSYQARIFGFLSERMLDIWLKENDINFVEVPVKFMEKQNWLSKGSSFIMRKIKN